MTTDKTEMPEVYKTFAQEAYELFPHAKLDEAALEYRERVLDWFEEYCGTIEDALGVQARADTVSPDDLAKVREALHRACVWDTEGAEYYREALAILDKMGGEK